MKKFLMAIMAVLVLASCAGNVFEQKAKVYTDATEKVAAAQNAEEIEAIVKSVDEEIKAIEESEDWKAYEALVEANDTAALKEFEVAQKACEDAQVAFAAAVVAAAVAPEAAQ